LIIFDVFWTQKLKFYQYVTLFQKKFFGIYLPIFFKNIEIFVKNMEVFENLSRDFGADLLFSVRAMGQIYFQCEE